jgi:hypothetical protein
MRQKISIRLNARVIELVDWCGRLGVCFYVLTGNEHVLIWSADELHCLLGVESKVFVDRIVGDIFICTVVKGNENIQEDCGVLVNYFVGWKSKYEYLLTITTKVKT